MVRRFLQVVRVEGTEQRIAGDPLVKATDQVDEKRLPANPIEECVHGVESRGFRMLTDSRP
jgi:hypothetical protein